MNWLVWAVPLALWTPVLGAAQTNAYPNKPIRMIVGPAAGGRRIRLRALFCEAERALGSAGRRREPPRRGQHHRRFDRREGDARRIYAALLPDLGSHCARALQNAAMRLHQGLRAGRHARHDSQRAAVSGRSRDYGAEFIAVAKAKPGAMNYASTGIGISTHLSMELFKSMAGIDVVHVPYRGIASPDLFRGAFLRRSRIFHQWSTSFDRGKCVPRGEHAQAQRVRAGAADDSRVRTSDSKSRWYGVCAPAAVPRPIVRKINADMVQLLNGAELRQRLELQGVEAAPSTPEAFAAFIKAETARWAKVVNDAGIPAR